MVHGVLPACVVLAPVPISVPRARSRARKVLRDRGLESFAEIAEVLVSELVTNAVKACGEFTRICPLLLWVLPGRAGVLVVVWDISPLPPVRPPADDGAESGPADDGAESGRGLMLVEALSARWGWRHAAGGGKYVWAVLGSWPGDPAGLR